MAAQKLKTVKAGTSVSHPSPKEALARHKIEEGDTPYDLEFRRQVLVAGKVMKKHRLVLRKLAR
jgi:hypothetical protein